MPVLSKGRSTTLATRLASLVEGKVSPCRMSFGLMATARHRVKGVYAGMRLEAYVFDPWLEAWVQNFRLRAKAEVAFAVNEPHHVMGMVEKVRDLAPAGLPVFRRPWDVEGERAVRAFCEEDGNARDLAALDLARGESLAVLSHQMIARLRAGDDARLRARLDALGALFARNGRGPVAAAFALEPLAVTVGERGESQATPHRFGGRVEGAPECRNCRQPLHRLLDLDTRALRLEHALPGVPRLPVATCLNCQTLSSPLVLTRGPGGWTIREQAPAESPHDFPVELEERPVRLQAPAAATGHRVGGTPDWIQGDETPDCPGCAQPMAFLAQLDTDDRLGLQFGDDGRLYGFVCPACVTVATLIQSA